MEQGEELGVKCEEENAIALDAELFERVEELTDTSESASVKRVSIQIADGGVGDSTVTVSPKSRIGKYKGGHLAKSQSEGFILDRILDERAAVPAGSPTTKKSASFNRRMKLRQARYVSKNPLLGDAHMLGTTEYVACMAEFDEDFATDCIVSDIEVCEVDDDQVQFEIPDHLYAMGADTEFTGQKYTEHADIAQINGFVREYC